MKNVELKLPLETELLILADGRILVHNLTQPFAELLRELNPDAEQISPRVKLSERRSPARRVTVGVQASACPSNTLKRELQRTGPETGALHYEAQITKYEP